MIGLRLAAGQWLQHTTLQECIPIHRCFQLIPSTLELRLQPEMVAVACVGWPFTVTCRNAGRTETIHDYHYAPKQNTSNANSIM